MWHSVDVEETTGVPFGLESIFTVCRVADSAEIAMRCAVNLFINTIFCSVGFYETASNMWGRTTCLLLEKLFFFHA